MNKALIERLNDIPMEELFNQMYHIKWEEGRNFKCPFPAHGASGKTPSGRFYPKTNSFGCFGCHKGGGPIHFVMNMDNIGFKEACNKLMLFKGIEALPEFSYQKYLEKLEYNKDVYSKKVRVEMWSSILAEAEYDRDKLIKLSFLFCEINLLSQSDFMQRARDLYSQSLEEFVGCTEESISFLIKENIAIVKQIVMNPDCSFQTERKFSNKESLSGLLDSTSVERWKDEETRYVFPVFLMGNIPVGFSGRAIKPHITKYLTRFDFGLSKEDILYGLDRAIPSIRERGYVIIVEGILDVLRCREAGFYNVVAPLSTALTEIQVVILKALTEKFLLTYDNDEGGEASFGVAKKHLDRYRLLYERVLVPAGEDPDSYGRNNLEGLKTILSSRWR